MTTGSGRSRSATIHDVAAAAGLSRGTVSRVLNDEPYVSPEARAAVEQAIRRVGYSPNAAARNLQTRRSKAIALIVHEPQALFVEDSNIGSILLGSNASLSGAGYQLVSIIIDSERDNERVAEYLRGGFVDGVIVVSAREGDPIARAIASIGIPAAFVGRPPGVDDIAYVGIDNEAAAHAITTRLRDTGRTRVGMIAAALDRDSGRDRLAGFTRAMGDAFDPELVAAVPYYSYDDGVRGMRELLLRAPDIDGVFAASDAVAAGVLDALKEAGRAVPEEIGVVGFDDSAWALRCQPPLSTVRQPAAELGSQAAQLVLDQLTDQTAPRTGLILDTSIVWRASA